ncbi:hypothetical protein POVCU1_044860 [Plasmodium ovale curtisi]|uniref:Uncharacterized protein n=1 Tax=Plasmodium ovale curtisi TaxID=864141 RepID=A0A1A8X3D6_PLAOA|nr:hypothetical protein POVCU1_044860 [Plasmodium ovale curtisi]
MINFESTKGAEKGNERKVNHYDYVHENNEKDEEINNILKNLKDEERELCFPLLDFYFLNKHFKYQNLKESLQMNSNVNEYINLKLLRKEVYPKDVFFKREQKKREIAACSKLMTKREDTGLDKRSDGMGIRSSGSCSSRGSNLTRDLLHSKKGNQARDKKYREKLKDKEGSEKGGEEGDNLRDGFPETWRGNDIVGTFNPVYNARDKVANESCIDSIPTIDIFYNSSKLLTIQTVFEPINNYIYLLRLLPKFCLPLYDSGILQYACEDPILNPKLRGLELSYRLLVHDILFYAFFSYLSDLPFWAKPPIEILRIYNYESLYSFNDFESEHTERLVFHNIKNILYNFSDTLNKIELLYPKNYYITIFPNIYFKNIIDFLKGEKFKLKKIVIVLKGKNYIDEKMINYIKDNLDNFKGITTENIKRDARQKYNIFNNQINNNDMEKKSTQSILEAIKKCYDSSGKPLTFAKRDKAFPQMDFFKVTTIGQHKLEASGKGDPQSGITTYNHPHNCDVSMSCSELQRTDDTLVNGMYKCTKEEDGIRVSDNMGKTHPTGKNPRDKMHINDANTKYSSCNDLFRRIHDVDISDMYNIDSSVYNMYYQHNGEHLKENVSIFEGKEKACDKNGSHDETSESSSSENDDTDDENIDGFFKTKKLKSTVYDKDNFSFSKFMNRIINYEKIIDYLNNDPQRQENEDSKIKFYIKQLLFEKSNVPYDTNEDMRAATEARDMHSSDPVQGGFTDAGETELQREATTAEAMEGTTSTPPGTQDALIERCDDMADDHSYRPLASNNGVRTDSGTSSFIGETGNSGHNSSYYIGNLIRNLRETYGGANFLSFQNGEEEEVQENSFNLDNVRDSLTRVTFNFN